MPIRTAILGYGRSGSSMHAGGVQNNPAFQMAAVCDIDPARRNQATERFKCPVYDDYHVMLRDEKLDLVIIVTRSDQHCQMTCDCLEAGVNVLVTKPWAVNAGEAERMVKAAKQSRKLLLPWLPARWGVDLRRLQQLVGEDAIGRVFLVRRAVCHFDTRNDWQTKRQNGGGYLLNWGPHIVDPPLVLLGSPVKAVYARMMQTINPGDVEDVFLAVMTLADGAVVQAEYTIAAEELPSWFVQGERGTIVVRGSHLKLHKKTPPAPDDPTAYSSGKTTEEEVVEEELQGALYGDTDEVYAGIAQALRNEKEFPVKPADALGLSRVLDAIRLASEQNRVVEM
jgi:scyllo-inositol 2-dehydrogenase (NADP+)